MLKQTVTHYFPWTESDDVAYCGHRMTEADVHSPAPTCLTCAVRQAAEEQAQDETVPLDADEARTALDPILNAGLPARAPLSPLGAELFSLARTLQAVYLMDLLDRPRRVRR